MSIWGAPRQNKGDALSGLEDALQGLTILIGTPEAYLGL